jgi:hypothetical protein
VFNWRGSHNCWYNNREAHITVGIRNGKRKSNKMSTETTVYLAISCGCHLSSFLVLLVKNRRPTCVPYLKGFGGDYMKSPLYLAVHEEPMVFFKREPLSIIFLII